MQDDDNSKQSDTGQKLNLDDNSITTRHVKTAVSALSGDNGVCG
jgi:hypothetical protein